MNDEEKPVVQGSVNVTDLFGLGAATKNLAPAATEIVKAVRAGFGKFYEPASIFLNERAQGLADRQNAIADAKAYLELQTRSPAVLEAMKARILGTEYRREENIIAASARAIEIAEQTDTEKKAEVDPDFVVEWIEGVKDVSQDQVRELWAKVMAKAPGEKAGRVEKPVMDFMKQLDVELAVELEEAYRASLATDGLVPAAFFEASMVAEEVGMGKTVEVTSIRTRAGFISFATMGENAYFNVFELGARAERLSEIVFGPLNDGEVSWNFAMNFPAWIESLAESTHGLTFYVSVRGLKKVYNFSISVHEGSMIRSNYQNPRVDIVDGMELPDDEAVGVVRGHLRNLTEAGALDFNSESPRQDIVKLEDDHGQED